ncbi:MAG: matrixin family metalloprotease [Thaumarchaeota archaeon]|nr:matrixin family metalloprotease [Nitrososphaerota archaeon]MBT5842646.1 matrixin family metalloprotease [Nitrososphaerota archaeon]MBT6468176.1 matrixin family metalloprotease [Nitrososphaerota archaeon]
MQLKPVVIGLILLSIGMATIIPIQMIFANESEWNSLLSWGNIKEITVYIESDFEPNAQKIEIIKSVIQSKLKDKENFFGWNEAITHISYKTETQIPIFTIINKTHKSDVIIHLTEMESSDPFLGLTKYQLSNQTIESVSITLYDFDELDDSQVEFLARHELGHAIGLGHTTNPFDLMYPNIDSEFGLISMFDLISLSELYN